MLHRCLRKGHLESPEFTGFYLPPGIADLPETLHEAVLAAQRIRSHGARTRQLQYIGKLMRQLEPSVLSRVRAALTYGRAGTPLPQP